MERALAEYLSHAPVFVRTLQGEITYWSQGARELYGYSWDEAVGRISHELLRTEFPYPLDEINAQLARTGRWQGLVMHTPRHGVPIWTESQWRLRGGEHGEAVVEMNTDVTHREILSRELAHRVKNTLTIVQGLARFSLDACDKSQMRRFEERLQALSEANDLLIRQNWVSAGLRSLFEAAVHRFHAEDRVRLDGPDVRLNPNSVIAYGLAVHELLTNALKYGALSTPEGRVEVVWSVRDGSQDRIHLVWRERGGPPAAAPERTGFGLRLIERAVSNELDAPVSFRFEPEGLVCEFDGPVQKAAKFGAAD